MHAISIVAVTAALLFSVASGLVVPRSEAPSSYATDLEDYHQYHARFLALNCQHKHHSNFFKTCCHPLLANQTLAQARPSYCTPSSSASASALAAEPTSTVTTPVDPDDDGENHCDAKPASSSAAPSPTASDVSPSPSPSDSPAPSPSDSPAPSPSDSPAPSPSDSPSPSPSDTEAAPSSSPAVVNVAPSPSPSPTHTQEPSPTTTSSTAQASPSTDSSSQDFTGGFGTFFFQNGVAGACGNVNPDSAVIVALDSARYDNGAHCGETVVITALGQTINAIVADECPTCDNENCLDMSVGLFTQFAAESVGQIDITWHFA